MFEGYLVGDWGVTVETGGEVAAEFGLREDAGDECGCVAEDMR